MKSTFPILLLVIILGCNSSSAEKVEGSNISSPAKNESSANDAAASASIKIFKDDKLVIEYKTSFPQAGITTFKSGEKEAALKLSNDDNTYNLIATLEKPASGNYPIGKGGSGKASLQLTTDGKGAVPFMTDLTEGTFKITFSGETCSGNFTGIQKENGMPNIRITGDFTSIPVIKNTVNY